MSLGRFSATFLAGAVAAAGLLLSPAFAAGESSKRPPAVSLSVDSDFGFTPATADPRLALLYGERHPFDTQVHEHAFRSLPPRDGRRGIVAARMRAAAGD